MTIKHLMSGLAFAGALFMSVDGMAANWLMLQGTEPSASVGRAKLWGFVQFQYQLDASDPNENGQTYIPPKMIGPNLTSQDAFNVNRARIGVRGTGFPLDPNVNYFVLAELGNNGITAANDGGTLITDASITLNHIKGARIRAGLFKAPMAEEGLQAIHVFDYINFTTVSNQLMLERFPNNRDSSNAGGLTLTEAATGGFNQFDKPVGAFRDVGVQVFDAFRLEQAWELSYAVMVGNGNGLNFSDTDNEKDVYAYVSLENLYGGGGPRRQGLKIFAWSQTGKRLLDKTGDGVYSPAYYDRERMGFGVKYLRKPFRATMEYMAGKGMIFVGPDKPTFDQNGAKPNADGSDGEASGWYVEGGYYVGNKWQFDLRYDVYNRLEGDPGANGNSFESEWKTVTLGVNYHFNKKTRLTLNIASRDVGSPEWDAGAGPNANMDGIAERYALQLTHIF